MNQMATNQFNASFHGDSIGIAAAAPKKGVNTVDCSMTQARRGRRARG